MKLRYFSFTLSGFFVIILCASLLPILADRKSAVAGEGSAQSEKRSVGNECVILLHGLGRTRLSMRSLYNLFVDDGYRVWSKSYPSTKNTIEQLSNDTITKALNYCQIGSNKRVHFVTHSLGGILLRVYLQDRTITNMGNIVMLSPPNHGSEVVDALKDNVLFQFFLGPAGQQLGTGEGSIPRTLKPIEGVIGIITGDRSYEPWFSTTLPGPDDGKVSTRSAKLGEMHDYLVVQSGHTYIMDDEAVIRQVRHFLLHSQFLKSR